MSEIFTHKKGAEILIATYNLCKNYKNATVLDNVNIKLERGKIYGFVGKNGAGKTTLLKIIAGTVNKTSGDYSLFGLTDEAEKMNARKRIGFLIENPVFFSNFDAMKNLKSSCILRELNGIEGDKVAKKIINLANLDNISDKKISEYSLGMKQKLGILRTLIGMPEIIILDEPMNGLDPEATKEIRDIIIKLNREMGVTFLISSHILSDLWLIATDYIFINKGVIMEEISKKNIEGRCKSYLSYGVTDINHAVKVLREVLKTNNFECVSNQKPSASKEIRIFDYLDKKEELAIFLQKNGVMLTHIESQGINLEEYFLSLIDSK